MNFLRRINPRHRQPDFSREREPIPDNRRTKADKQRGDIDPALTMQRALREDGPTRLRQRLESVEARAKDAEEEARKAKSALAKLVVDSARAETDAKDAQDQIRAEMQAEIDELRLALRTANATGAQDAADLTIPQEAKDALKEKLARRLETMQESHSRNLQTLSKDAEARVAREIESKIKEARADWERVQKKILAERDQYWKDELKRRESQTSMPGAEASGPIAAMFGNLLPRGHQNFGFYAIAVVAAVIGFSIAQIVSGPTENTAVTDRPVETASVTAPTVVPSPSEPPPNDVSTAKPETPGTDTATESDSTKTIPPTAAPEDTVAETPAAPVEAPETTPPVAVAEPSPPVTARDTGTPAANRTPAGPESGPNENPPPAPVPAPPAATAQTAPKQTPPERRSVQAPADNSQMLRIVELRRQAAVLRERLEAAEKRERAATVNALAARVELEETKTQLETLTSTPTPAGGPVLGDPDDFFFLSAE
ncbi:MAG: hypothetical protein MJE12_01355 [Alphaproteobacteria bacterium]|nr:hypothetical protein [Alphaproteobacteria bacterium]